MSWGRGFFRVWLVLSGLWIGPCIYGFKPATYSWLWKGSVYAVSLGNNGRQVTLDTSRSRSELVSDLFDALKLEAQATKLKPPVLSDTDEILAAIDSKYTTDGDKAREAWLVTLVPPLSLLGLGLAIAWILRGFRSRADA
ncbi:hypothetical protein [Bradyrhizobium sp. LTSP857]|uniref:hypothetical protein n=1 Tax=Bradyrhizobium sp. LTSP857 TaxID=1619231 RepID=UPI0005D1F8D9|nr:hypothetical protein [Bradyrhizobium sp. LTSP857]KJC42256.1 hypothetical protein UP06_23755 [Bradyrhizobium sp. LTSP857]